MKFIILLTLLLAAPAVFAQTVEIQQSTAEACARCFDEAKASREAIAKLEVAAAKDEEAIRSLTRLAEFYEKTIAAQAVEIRELRTSLRELMDYVIKRPSKKCSGLLVLGC